MRSPTDQQHPLVIPCRKEYTTHVFISGSLCVITSSCILIYGAFRMMIQEERFYFDRLDCSVAPLQRNQN
uniref:Uncharacterized protein n=1 Tax=Manihot esculenta TaxID=3983 RepID=A0A251JGU3_MANES